MPDDTKTIGQYDEDYYVWAMTQAHALRSAGAVLADARANDWPSTLSGLDWENLAEEIESLGRRDRRELGSRIETIIEHLLKLEYSLATDPRRGWQGTIRRERDEVGVLLRDSPSLRRQVRELIEERAASVVKRALADLQALGELPGNVRPVIRAIAPYTEDQILSDWWPESPTVDECLHKTTKTEPNP